jgi:hypothetical protein
MDRAPYDEAASAARDDSRAVGWRAGWKRRVYLWGGVLAVLGFIIGSNTNLQEWSGTGGSLGLTGCLMGWFGGAFLRLSIEALHANQPK